MARLILFLIAIPAARLAAASHTLVDPMLRPVSGAHIECGGASTVTDADGRFSFPESTSCSGTAAATGFEPAPVKIEPGKSTRVQLTLAHLTEKMVVSATRAAASLEESGVSATVFTARDLADRQSPALVELLRSAPGVSVAQSGTAGAITSIFTRGGASTTTLFLLDGVPLNQPGGQLDISGLTTAGLDRVEVVRGAESALFGSDAASGVVQLFSSRGSSEDLRPHGSFAYERGSYSTDHWTANVNGGLFGRADYSLTADQFHTLGQSANNYFRNTSGTANAGVKITEGMELRAIFREYDSVAGNPGQTAYGSYTLDAYGGNRQSTLGIKLDDVRGAHFAERFSFGYDRLRNVFADSGMTAPIAVAALVEKRATPTPRVYLSRLVAPGFSAADVPAGLTLVRSTLYDWPSSFAGIDSRTSFEYQGSLAQPAATTVFGYRFERQSGDISFASVKRDNQGAFVHHQHTFGRRLYITAGARAEHSTTFGARFVPRASAAYQITSSTLVRVSGGLGYMEPTLLENFANEKYYVGNRALRPERTVMFDAGVAQELPGRRIRLEATWFRNAFRDLIVYDSSKFPSTWSNIDRSWARGMELTATGRLTSHVQLGANYTLLNTRIVTTNSASQYTGVGQQLPRRPRNSAAAWVSMAHKRGTLMVGGRVVGERQDSDYTFGVTRNPRYSTMFVNASWQVNRYFRPYFRMDNLLDARYQEVLGYAALGRNAVGGMQFTW